MYRKSLILLLMLLFSKAVFSQSLYRYKDENGVTVLNNSIPAEYVTRGYEVMDARTGQVIESVAPVDTGGARVYQTPDDKILLASYSSIEEIDEHLQRKVNKLNAEVANIQTDKRVVGIELQRQKKELERLQDGEREIPGELPAHIAELEQSLVGLDDALKRREGDLERTIQEYEAKSRRFELLQSVDDLL